MVKIFNPYSGRDPLATTMANLGKTMFGDKTANALRNQKLLELERNNTETDNLMKAVSSGGGVQANGSDPNVQGMLIGSGYDPAKFGAIGRMGAATQYGATDPRTQNWQVGTGSPYSATAGAFNATLGETRRNNDMQSADRRYGVDQNVGERNNEFVNAPKPALDQSGNPVFAPQGDLTNGNYQPVLSNSDRQGTMVAQHPDLTDLNPSQQAYVGADTKAQHQSPKNYIVAGGDGKPHTFITYDGQTDAQTGQQLPQGGYIGNVQGGAGDVGLTNSTQSQLQQADIANKNFANLIAKTEEVAKSDPTNFGLPGFIKGGLADVNILADGLAKGLGSKDIADAVARARQDAVARGIDPGMLSGFFDPNISKLQTLSDLLAYSAASALAGQSGRSVSDKDVHMFKRIVGDPENWMMSQQKFLAKLDVLKQILGMNDQTVQQYLGGHGPQVPLATNQPAPSGAPTPPVASAPAAAPVAPAPAQNVDPSSALNDARAAIKQGAPRDAVVKRLQEMGVPVPGDM